MDAFAKRSNNHRKETVPVAAPASTAPLRAIKVTRSIPIGRGRGQNRCQNERNPTPDHTTPWVLVDGVVSSTGMVSMGESSMFSRMDCARW